MQLKLKIVYLFACFAIVACSSGGDSDAPPPDPIAPDDPGPTPPPSTPPPTGSNTPPVASVDVSASSIDERQPVVFDARASYDDDGDTLTYAIDLGSLPHEQVETSHNGRVWTVTTSEVDETATYSVDVTVSDGQADHTVSTQISVNNYDRTPLSNVWGPVSHEFAIASNGSARFSENGRDADFQTGHASRRTAEGDLEIIEFSFAGSFDNHRVIPLDSNLSSDVTFITGKLQRSDDPVSFAILSKEESTVQIFERETNQTTRPAGSTTFPGICSMQWVYLRLSESFVFSPSLYIGTNNGLWTFLNEIARDTLFSSDELFQFVEVTESSGDYCNATNYASFFDAAANELIVLDTETYGSPDFPQSTPVSVPPGLTFVAMKDGKIKFDVEYYALLFAGETHDSAHRLTILHETPGGQIEQVDYDLLSGIPTDLFVQSIDTNFFDLQYGRGEGDRDMDIVIAVPETPYVYVVTVEADETGALTFSPLEFVEVGFGVSDVMVTVTDSTNRYSLLTNDGNTLRMHESLLEFSRF